MLMRETSSAFTAFTPGNDSVIGKNTARGTGKEVTPTNMAHNQNIAKELNTGSKSAE